MKPPRTFTDDEKLEIVRQLWRKLQRKELGPRAAIWVSDFKLYLRPDLFDEIDRLPWDQAETMAQTPARKPIVSAVAPSTKSRKRA